MKLMLNKNTDTKLFCHKSFSFSDRCVLEAINDFTNSEGDYQEYPVCSLLFLFIIVVIFPYLYPFHFLVIDIQIHV